MINTLREINETSTQEISEWITSLDGKEATLIIDSGGGEVAYEVELRNLLSKNLNIELVAFRACSAAFTLFIFSKNKKRLSPYFIYGMIHMPNSQVWILGLKHPHPPTPASVVFNDFDRIVDIDKERILELLNPEQENIYLNGEDVYFGYTEMQEILKKVS